MVLQKVQKILKPTKTFSKTDPDLTGQSWYYPSRVITFNCRDSLKAPNVTPFPHIISRYCSLLATSYRRSITPLMMRSSPSMRGPVCDTFCDFDKEEHTFWFILRKPLTAAAGFVTWRNKSPLLGPWGIDEKFAIVIPIRSVTSRLVSMLHGDELMEFIGTNTEKIYWNFS